MPDLYLEWQGDFVVSASGGLLLADGLDFARQRIERRLFTAVRGYVWEQSYGAGLPQKIGSIVDVPGLTALVRSQIADETSVAPNPPATVAIDAKQAATGLYTITITYTVAATGEPVTLTFSP